MLDQTDDVRLARLAVTAGASATESPGYPFAPQTAAAAVEILAARPGDLAARTLEQMSRTVVNKALRGRVLKAR